MIKKFKSLSKAKKRLSVVSLILVLAIVSGGLYLIFKPEDGVGVTLATVETGSICQTFETSAKVESNESSSFPIVEGVLVKDVLVSLGESVKAGQALATFDTSLAKVSLAQKQSDYNKALTSYNDSLASASQAKTTLPELEKQIAETEAQVAKYEKIVADARAEAEKKSESESTETTTVPQSGADGLAGLVEKVMNIGGTLENFTKMLESFNSMNNTSFDINSIMASSYNTPDMLLMQYQVQLMQLKAQKTTLEASASGTVSDALAVIKNTTYASLQKAQNVINELDKGWFAQSDGIVTELNIKPNSYYQPQGSAGTSGIDISTLITALSGNIDINQLVSAIAGSASSEASGMKIQNYNGFIASFTIGKYDMQTIKVGQSATITSVSGEFTGEVVYVSPTASESTSLDIASIASSFTGGGSSSSSALVKVKINNPDTSIVIGFDVDIKIVTGTVENTIVIPVESVKQSADGPCVFVYNAKNKTVEKRAVKFGINEDKKYEVLSGLSVGETIIAKNDKSIDDGTKVTIKKAEETTKSQA
ncbi:MAG: hypothetical protein GX051_00985 [Clostridiales bacterium]|nr:hypothetical protein [Clostridiales bacterium]